jgi:hypothetical protein
MYLLKLLKHYYIHFKKYHNIFKSVEKFEYYFNVAKLITHRKYKYI